MCSKSDSEATYCSEVEDLIKVSSNIKRFVPQISSQPLRRSQRILNKSKKQPIDLNDFCFCDLKSCIDKVNNKRKRKCSDKTGLQTNATQDVLPTEDLGQVYPTFVCEQLGTPWDKRLELQCDVPLDLSKKSKELANETSKAELYDSLTSLKKETLALENKIPEVSSIADLKLKPIQEVNQIDRKQNTVCKNKKRSRKNPKIKDKNIDKITNGNCSSTLKEFKELKKSPLNKTSEENGATITDIQNTVLKTEITTITIKPIVDELQTLVGNTLKSNEVIYDLNKETLALENKIPELSSISGLKLKPIQEVNQIDRKQNTVCKNKKRTRKNLKTNDKNFDKITNGNCSSLIKEFKELKKSPLNTTTEEDGAITADLHNTVLETKITTTTSEPIIDELQTFVANTLKSNKVPYSDNCKSRESTNKCISSKNVTQSTETEQKSPQRRIKRCNKRTAILMENLPAKVVKIDDVKAELPLETNQTLKANQSFRKNSNKINSIVTSNTSVKDFKKVIKINKKSKRNPFTTKLSTLKIKAFKRPIWPNTNTRSSKVYKFKDSEKNYGKTVLKMNSEEIKLKTEKCGIHRPNRRLSLPENVTKPMKQDKIKSKLPVRYQPLRRPLPSTKFFKEFANSQNLLTPTQSTQDMMSKFMLVNDCPPHFKQQLQIDIGHSRPFMSLPNSVITPDTTPSVKLSGSLSSSPSLPDSLCELLQTKDIKKLLNIDKVAYRIYDYHIQPLALILNQSQQYLRQVLDKVVSIHPNILKNVNKAVEGPFAKDKDLFANSSDESLTGGEDLFHTVKSNNEK